MVKTFWSRHRNLMLVVLLAVVTRIAAALYLGNQVVSLPGTSDQVSYHALALRVLDGHGFSFGENWWPMTAAHTPTAHWSFPYTLYLVAVYKVFGPNPLMARIIQAIIVGILQPYLAYRLAAQTYRLLYRENKTRAPMEIVPLVAAGIAAVYLYFIYYAAALMTESFYILAILGSLSLAIALVDRPQGLAGRRLALALGVTLGAAVLLRQVFLLFVPCLLLWLLLTAYRQGAGRRAMAAVAMAAAIVVLLIAPFTLYNYSRFQRFVLLNTNAGYAFYLANHPSYGSRFTPASEMTDYQSLVPSELRQLDEAALDQELLKRGLGFVIDDPGRYLLLSLSRLPEYFKFWPDLNSGTISNVARVGSFALFLPFMAYGLVRPLVRLGRLRGESRFRVPDAPILLLYLFIITYTAVHVFSWAQVRYRLPVDAVLVIPAALGVTEVGVVVLTALARRRGPGPGRFGAPAS